MTYNSHRFSKEINRQSINISFTNTVPIPVKNKKGVSENEDRHKA